MNIQIDRQNDVPRITENGKIVYSEKSDTLYIRTLKEGTKAIGGNSSIIETDPVFTSWLASPPNVSTFTNDAGYLTSFSETDPIYTASSWYSTTNNSTDWNSAYGWGNHASAGYLTSISSLDVTTALGYTPVTNARTLTINGTTYDLSSNRSWTISTGTTYTFSTGLTDTAGTITSNLSTGISGGQSVVGGTASGNNLTLSSTSNATKGKIIFGTSAYDEVNNRLGVGTTTPANLLSILGNSTTPGGVSFNVKNSNVSGDTRFSLSSSNNRTLNVQVTGDSYVVNQKGAYLFTDGGLSNMTFMTDGDVGSGGSGYISFATGGYTLTTQERMRITSTGNIGIGQTSPTAVLHIKAGTATAGTAPLKLTSGTRLTVVESGTVEFTTNNFYLSPSSTVRLTAGLGTNGTLYSTAFGLDVLNGNTTGAENTGFGYYALRANTTGVGNTSLGVGCLVSNTQGSRNVAVGYGALNVFNSTSNVITSNTAIGNAAMFSTTTGVFNTAVGGYVAQQAQSSYGTYYGIQAGYTVHGNYNLAIGHFAMGSTTINAGTYNIAIGTNALLTQTAGANNIGIGTSTMVNLTGAGNVAIGFSALNAVIGGGYNISLGFQSGNAITTGSKNVTIGYDVDAQSNTADGQLSIQNAIFGTGNTGTGTTASTGNVGLYVVAPTARLHLPAGTTAAGTAPLKLTSGTNLTTPEDGTFEFDGTNLYFTVGGVRKTVTLV